MSSKYIKQYIVRSPGTNINLLNHYDICLLACFNELNKDDTKTVKLAVLFKIESTAKKQYISSKVEA